MRAVFLAIIFATSALGEALAAREVNVTSDSATGWVPSASQEDEVRLVTDQFFAALDAGEYTAAYGLQTELQKGVQSLAKFTESGSDFNAMAGSVKYHRVAKVTWTKDPAQSPAPGVYAAIDLVSAYANVDRHCGYIILYQAPSGGNFRVMRQESVFMENRAADKVAPAAAERSWAETATKYCPNYK